MRRYRRFLPKLLLALTLAAALPAAGPARPAVAADDAAGRRPPADAGTWMAASDGGIFAFGSAPFYGSMGGQRLNKPIVAISATPTGHGYWLVASDGGVFAFGDAGFYGSTGAIKLVKPIVAMASTATGRGYWLVASDGGVFAFGDAGFYGSTGAIKLVKPIVGMARTATGNGYWLVASDGGIFTFGDAVFRGGLGAVKLNRPIIGMATTPSGKGYWLAGSDGGIFTFGDATYAGSTGNLTLSGPIVALTATPQGQGYWLAGSDGGVFSFGDATFGGSLGNLRLAAPIVALTPRPVVTSAEVSIFFYPWYATPSARTGYRHWEQNGHTPPDDIGANFYPAGGLYNSLDPTVLLKQAKQMAASGVDVVVSSWWGQGSYEDWMLPDLVTAVKAAGLRLAIHVEPYKGRTATSVAGDLTYLQAFGIRDVYLYQADTSGSASDWAAVTAANPDVRFFAETGNLSSMLSGNFEDFAHKAGFDGIYTYDAIRYGANELASTCAAARARRLLCAPSVAPGFDARRSGSPKLGVTPSNNGERYDSMWKWAMAAGADVVSITSWNEWHEGTQIEPAKPYCFQSDGYCSPGYEGAYGRTGTDAQTAYMDRTAKWAADFRSLRAGR